MIEPGSLLLDTGPLVALLDRNDQNHQRVKEIFSKLSPPFLTCEPVLTEAWFLAGRRSEIPRMKILELGQNGFYKIGITLQENWETLMIIHNKYEARPISLADACLIRCAEIHNQSRILTFDSDFEFYRWGRNKKFEVLK